jgi:hypothetical protein
MNTQSKKPKVTAIRLCLGTVGWLTYGVSGFLHLPAPLHASLVGLGIALVLVALIPSLYEDWTKHGKSRRIFILIMVIFILPLLFISTLALKDYFLNSH